MSFKVISCEQIAGLIPTSEFTTTGLFNQIDLKLSRNALEMRLKYLSKYRLITFSSAVPRMWCLNVDKKLLIKMCKEIDKNRGALVNNDQRKKRNRL